MPVDAAVLGVVDRVDARRRRAALAAAGRGARGSGVPLTTCAGGRDDPRHRRSARSGRRARRAGSTGGRCCWSRRATPTGEPTGRLVVAIDVLDARAGEDVTVAFGSGARNVLRPGRTTATCCATRRSRRSSKGPTDVPRARGGDGLVDGEVAGGQGAEAAAGAARIGWAICRRARPAARARRPPSRPTIWSSAPTCWTPGRATTCWSRSVTPRASRSASKLPPGTKPNVPIDAAVVAVVDRVEIDR